MIHQQTSRNKEISNNMFDHIAKRGIQEQIITP